MGQRTLIREIAAFFHKEEKAEELCRTLDAEMADSLEKVKQYTDHPRVAVIHFGRASNVYLVVGKGGGGDGGGVSQMIELAGGEMALEKSGMQRMDSPEIIAQANPDVVLVTDYGFDRLGGDTDQIKALPGVETSNAAKNGRIYRIEENQLNYFGPRTGENVEKGRRDHPSKVTQRPEHYCSYWQFACSSFWPRRSAMDDRFLDLGHLDSVHFASSRPSRANFRPAHLP